MPRPGPLSCMSVRHIWGDIMQTETAPQAKDSLTEIDESTLDRLAAKADRLWTRPARLFPLRPEEVRRLAG